MEELGRVEAKNQVTTHTVSHKLLKLEDMQEPALDIA